MLVGYIGGAFGIEDVNNFFAVYYDGTNINLLQVTDGGQPVFRSSAAWSPTNDTDYAITIELAKPAGNYEVTVTEGANTLLSAYNVSQHGYDGGYVGIFAQNGDDHRRVQQRPAAFGPPSADRSCGRWTIIVEIRRPC